MEEINIKDFFIYLKKYFFAFVAVIATAVIGVVIYDTAIKKPMYQANTTVIIAKSDGADGAAASLNDVNASQKLVSNYSEFAKSESVLNQVIENLNLKTNAKSFSKNLTIKPIDDTSILSITVRNLNPRLSAMIANEIVDVFSKQVVELYPTIKMKQLSVAAVPENPSNNTLTRDIVLAVVVAVAIVGGFAFVKFYLDDTVKHSDDVEKNLGMSTAGSVLKGDSKIKKSSDELIVERYPKAIISENIKSLRTNLQFTSVDRDLETILVTSTNAGEGKSFISSNLAVSFAQAGARVLLVDCDLRKGRLHKIFGLTNTEGLSNLLASDLRGLSKYIRPTKTNNLDVITCGTYPPNPSELLASQKNKRLIKILQEHYDIVIFDGVPLAGLADSVILSSLVDETLVVVRDGFTAKTDLAYAKESLDKVGARIAGVVFNMVNQRATKYYSSYYYGDTGKR